MQRALCNEQSALSIEEIKCLLASDYLDLVLSKAMESRVPAVWKVDWSMLDHEQLATIFRAQYLAKHSIVFITGSHANNRARHVTACHFQHLPREARLFSPPDT